jgi:PQQ-dependent dehydrogenase (methanol/ethanol family)
MFMTASRTLLALSLFSALCARAQDDNDLANASQSNEWLTYGHDYAETRFSTLTEINDGNVGELGLAWSFDTDSFRGLEATPLVHDGILYATRPWSSVFALDARTGKVLWDYDPKVDKSIGWKACCDVVNRGVALYDGKIYVGTIDGRLIALNATSGEELWSVVTVDQSRPYTITGAPRIADGKVLIGNGGSELGARGYVTAYDAQTGAEAWRFWVVPGNPGLDHLRSRVAAGLRGDRQRFPVEPRATQCWTGRQSVSVVDRGAARRYGSGSVVLPDHTRR